MTEPVNRLVQYLTPEQEAALKKDGIQESLGPFDFGPGLGAKIGAAASTGLAAYMIKDWPWLFRHYGLRDGALEAGKWLGAATVPAGIGYLYDLKDRAFDRQKAADELLTRGSSGYQQQRNVAESEKLMGYKIKYPPQFPRVERSESEMRERYDRTRTGGFMDNRYGILGGGKLPYDEWLRTQEKYGATLHFPPSMNSIPGRDYPIAPETHGYGPGPYPARQDDQANKLLQYQGQQPAY